MIFKSFWILTPYAVGIWNVKWYNRNNSNFACYQAFSKNIFHHLKFTEEHWWGFSRVPFDSVRVKIQKFIPSKSQKGQIGLKYLTIRPRKKSKMRIENTTIYISNKTNFASSWPTEVSQHSSFSRLKYFLIIPIFLHFWFLIDFSVNEDFYFESCGFGAIGHFEICNI